MLNVTTDDRLLSAFARRLDARSEWNAIKEEANKRDDKSFFQKMVAAEQMRVILGESILWRSGANRVIRLLLDAASWSAIGYVTFQFFDDNDEKEADALLDDFRTVIEYLEKDMPETSHIWVSSKVMHS